MESMKNRERKSNRFTLCFKPVDDMKDGGGGGTKVCPDDRVSDNNAADIVAGEDDTNDSRIVPVTSSGLSDEGVKVSVSVSVSDEVVVGKMKKRAKLSRIVKAVFFETSLAKKMRKKKSRKNLLRSSSNISTNSDKNSNSTDDKSSPRVSSSDEDNNHNKNLRTNSSFSSSLTSGTTTTLGLSNSSSMTSSSSRSMSERKSSSFRSNSIELKKQREDGWNYGLCLLLVSLLVLVLWGKVCAILCTSAWLFFVPRRNSIRQGSSEIGVGLPEEVDSVEYKKKVIMEGLLGRNRTRRVL